MEYGNPLIDISLSDTLETDKEGKVIYALDCHNLPICKSYNGVFWACHAGAYSENRCSQGEKIQIRILNDMNPNAIHKPKKPSIQEIHDYING